MFPRFPIARDRPTPWRYTGESGDTPMKSIARGGDATGDISGDSDDKMAASVGAYSTSVTRQQKLNDYVVLARARRISFNGSASRPSGAEDSIYRFRGVHEHHLLGKRFIRSDVASTR